MAQKIHYQDDIYFVHRVVKLLRDALKLEIDPEYCAPRVVSDLRYAVSSIRTLHGALKANTRVVERPEYLKLLLRSACDLSDVASELLSGAGELSAALAPSRDELQIAYQDVRLLSEDIRNVLGELVGGETFDVDVVSHDELSELLNS